MTARDIIRRALKLGGVIAAGETPTAEEQVDALASLNDMLDVFSNENLMIPANSIETFTLAANQQTFTMGPTGDFNTVRPMGVDKVSFVDVNNGNGESPVNILSIDEWQRITNKGSQSTRPMRVYPEPTFPLYTLNFWPIPSLTSGVKIYSHKQLSNLATPDVVLSLPPGYNQLLIYNLWIVLAPEYGRDVTPLIASIAGKAKSNVKRTNRKIRTLRTDAALHGRRRNRSYRGE